MKLNSGPISLFVVTRKRSECASLFSQAEARVTRAETISTIDLFVEAPLSHEG
jgi:hypothetical protein